VGAVGRGEGMSAFAVSKTHIAALVKFYTTGRRDNYESDFDRFSPENDYRTTMAQCLSHQNARSVNHRYPDHDAQEPETYTNDEINRAPELTHVQAIKAADCLAYQSCETGDYRGTRAGKLLTRIRESAVRTLPGYDAAPWAIEQGVRTIEGART